MSGFPDLSRDFLITGASSGLGRALMRALAPGRRLLLHGRDLGRLEEAAGEAEALGAEQVTTLSLDLAEPRAGISLARHADKILGTAPGLALNAGFSLHGAATEQSDVDCARELATNARSILDFLHEFGPRLRSDGGGDVLITSSLAGLHGIPEQAGYAASKAFLLSFGSSLSAEWRSQGIQVTTYAAGLMDTAFFERGRIPLDRRWARLAPLLDPDVAARSALSLLQRGRMIGTSGWRNRLALFLPRILSRRRLASVASWACER